MLSQHIALVPEAGGVNASDLARVCGALQKQLQRDILPTWGGSATINAFPQLEDVPLGYWPVVITFCELGDQAGVQFDRSGQPFAQIEMSPDWSLHASRACLEMITNPFGSRIVAGSSPRPDQGWVEFLVDVCGPCAGADGTYVIDDVLVSDFCTPAYWGTTAPSRNYSFTGAIHAPQQVLLGGHLTWHDPITDKWWVRHQVADALLDTKLGSIDARTLPVREVLRAKAPRGLGAPKTTIEALEGRLGVRRQHALQASQFRAHRLRTLIAPVAVAASGVERREVEGRTSQSELLARRTAAMLAGRARVLDDSSSNGVEPAGASDDDGTLEVNQSELLGDAQPEEAPATTPYVSAAAAAAATRPPPLPQDSAVETSRGLGHSHLPAEQAQAPGALSAAAPPGGRTGEHLDARPESGHPPASAAGAAVSTAQASLPLFSTPPMAMSYPPARAPNAKTRWSSWVVGAAALAGATVTAFAAIEYNDSSASPRSAPHAVATPVVTPTPVVAPTPVVTSAPAVTPTPVAVAPGTPTPVAPAQAAVAPGTPPAVVAAPTAVAPGTPPAAIPSAAPSVPAAQQVVPVATSAAATPKAPRLSVAPKPARPAAARAPVQNPRPGRTADEPASESLDDLIVERR
jgi:hypothetical protein